MVRRMVTLSGAEYVMPRSWHSLTSYLSCRATGSPHLLQKVGVLRLNAPHLPQITSPDLYGLVTTDAPQARQVVQPAQVPALTFPVADGIIHEIKLGESAEILNREHRSEHRLQAVVLALAGQQIHLQETLVRALLHFDQVRDLDGGADPREVQPVPFPIVMPSIVHFALPHARNEKVWVAADWAPVGERHPGRKGARNREKVDPAVHAPKRRCRPALRDGHSLPIFAGETRRATT